MHLNVMATPTEDDDLRLLYLDWCSTRVARRFLELSHDEVWLRSHLAETLPAAPGEPVDWTGEGAAEERVPGYLDLVRRTALLLAEEMKLPSYAEWRGEYLKDPTGIREDLLGG
jgi:hypothetical protein